MSTLVLNECFAAWQGEGPSAGRRCSFVRLMSCNLTCDWTRAGGVICDEAQTWNAKLYDLHAQGKRTEAGEIAERAAELGQGMVVITGGEPLLHQAQEGWAILLLRLRRLKQRIEVETNGTQQPAQYGALVDQWNVSPKLASSGVEYRKRIVPEPLRFFVRDRRAVFKFVCTGTDDVAEAFALAEEYRMPPGRVWIMPEGTSPYVLMQRARELAPAVLAAGFNLTLRQHHLVYGPEGEPR